jgi:hypothetical protein
MPRASSTGTVIEDSALNWAVRSSSSSRLAKLADVGRVAERVQRPVRTVSGTVGVAVPGEVDGHQGTVQGHRHRVPGMGVLTEQPELVVVD